MSVRPGIDTVKVKGRGQRSLDSFVSWAKKEYPQLKTVQICDTIEECVRDADIISMTTSASNSEATFPYIAEEWIKKGALISMPSAARFDEEFLVKRTKKVVDNWKLYEAWEEEYPYPTYDQLQIIGTKFTDLRHLGKITQEEIIDISVTAKSLPIRLTMPFVSGPVTKVPKHCAINRRQIKWKKKSLVWAVLFPFLSDWS